MSVHNSKEESRHAEEPAAVEFEEKKSLKVRNNLVTKLLKEVNESQKYFDTIPTSAEEYVEYKKKLEKCTKRLEELDNHLSYLRDLYDLADEFQVPIPDEVMENYYSFTDALSVLQATIERINSEQAYLTDEFCKKIDINILNLFHEVDKINSEVYEPWLTDVQSDSNDVKAFLSDLNDRLTACQAKANKYKAYQRFFRVEVTKFDILDEASEAVRLRTLLWDCIDDWDRTMLIWEEDNFHNLDVEQMNTFLAVNLKYVMQFKKGLPDCELINIIKEKVQAFKDIMPTIVTLRNPDLRNQHWYKIEQILGVKLPQNQPLTLVMLKEFEAFKFGSLLAEVSGQASSEATLEALLKKVEDSWKGLDLIVLPYKDYNDMYILGSLEDIQLVMEEVNINLNTIITSKHVGMIKSRVIEWIKSMEMMANVLAEWTSCQTNWIYLESIFAAPDIQRQLPNETKMFNQVNRSWRNIMKNASKNPTALTTCTDQKLLNAFKKNNQLLEQILLCLEAYLESKRVVFPRFYFLSNDELIEIIAQARNPRAVQPHMSKCFDAIWRIQFENDNELGEPILKNNDDVNNPPTDIVAMISPEKELVKFSMEVKARGNVEFWLYRLEEAMVDTLRSLMMVAITDFDKTPRKKWVLLHAGQLVLAVSQMMWCRDIHVLLRPGPNVHKKLLAFEQKCFSNLNELAAMVRGELTRIQRAVVGALITIDVHARDIVTSMVQNKVNSDTNFEWLKRLRYYWDEIDSCVACMANARWLYAFEYLGCSDRLVITPLTDKCYLCLMGALQLNLGGAPAGPAGTGKTETTKDLAKAMATQCVVFNCSDGLDYKMMGKFFAGLAQSGAWCCFDEFNRIYIEVLSVIAQQLITIMNAKVTNSKRFIFEGREIKLIKTCAAFITMNPGYAGRTELPDNLQALFRPMAMMVPDYGLIAEVILYSEGFESSKMLAQKMVNMYKLCSEQLSIQDHYDFGMRAVKSVLVMAGSLKRKNPTINENLVLIRALRDSNLPKFLKDDVILFQGILNDLFPGVILPEQDYGLFLATVKNIMELDGLQVEECIFVKVIQLLETIIVRHGIMTVGPTGGGKTTVLKILGKTLTQLYENGITGPYYKPVNTYTLNPKAITMGELYGEVNLLTMEWTDGLLGKFVRSAVQSTNEEFQWVVCDGPVDAVWIENLNTVLDDNKMLCLANSERIKLTSWVRMIFEVGDLSQASPATVSRCGMVFVDPSDLGWLPYVRSWINRLSSDVIDINNEYKTYLLTLIETYVGTGFTFIEKNCSSPIKQAKISKAVMMCTILESLLTDPHGINKIMDNSKVRKFICQSLVFAYVWGLGANLVDSSQTLFETFVFNQFEDNFNAAIPPGTELKNVYLNMEKKQFDSWTEIVPDFVYNKETPYFELLVPTVDSVRYSYVSQRLVQMNQPIMLSGVTGVGKTSVANFVMNNLVKTGKWITGMINFSAQTNSNRTQEIVESKLEKKKRTVFGAPGNKRIAFFIDDVNMPRPEIYGAQPPIELLRQLLDFGGLYDREKLFWKDIENVIVCSICAPPGGGRNPLTPRFTRHFSMMFIPSTSEKAMKTIFTSILDGFLEEFPPVIARSSSALVQASVDVYLRIMEDLLPTPAKSHYIFNLRDLSKTIQGILQADFSSIPDLTRLYRLWYHETLRVYHDRLVCQEDKSYFHKLLQSVSSRYLSGPVLEFSPTDENFTNPPMLIFGDFMNPVSKDSRVYEEITNIEKLKAVLLENLLDFNMLYNKDMQLIFFVDAIEHVTRIARILRSERGNALLVGVSGMGKQSLTKLASHLNEYKCFQIELTKSYDYASFHEDLVSLYHRAGADFEDTTFLFTDSQIVQEEFLEDINNILSSGEVPNLFKQDDLEKVIVACRQPALESGVIDSRDAIFVFFIQRVRSKLHLVISMSPVGDAFRRRCRLFPSLVNNSTIDWFDDWPTEALLSVAKKSLEQFLGPEDPILVDNLSNICNYMHEIVSQRTKRFFEQMRRYYYVTPSSYLELLKLFKIMHIIQTKKIQSDSDRFSNGLHKLYETFDMVGQMKTRLKGMAPALLEKNEAMQKLMENLIKEKSSVDAVRKVVLTEEAAAKVKAKSAKEIAADAQKDLMLAMPALEAAKKALEALNKNDINELRVFNKPPRLVQVVMEAVCLLLNQKKDWANAKVVLGDSNFLKKLQEYDIDNISEKMINQLVPYIEDPDFNPQKVATQSKVAKSMCMWVLAVHSYSLVYRVVEPKRKKQREAENELLEVLKELETKQKMLADVQARLQKLEEVYDQNIAERDKLEANINRTQLRLKRANLLVVALKDEQRRWEKNIKIFSQRLLTVTGDMIIAAGSINYLGPFTDEYRKEITTIWLQKIAEYEIIHSPNYSLSTVLIDSFEQRSWNICGLPRDSVSTDNAIIVTRASRWPLMIDPQEQANRWIKALEAQNMLKVCKATNSGLISIIVGAIRVGYPILIEGLEEHVDPTLRPVLENNTYIQGGRLLIRIGNTDIEYSDGFRFYMTTKLSNPHYMPEICIQVTLVNFTVTPSGLEDQLLVEIVRLERPDLEDKRTATIVSINDDNNLLKEMEDKTLRMLYTTEGNILDDEELIETLNNSKETSIIIASRLIDAEETEISITTAREKYRPVAKRGSCLYFVVSQLSEIDSMYQFSLNYFNSIFCNVIKNSNKSLRIDVKMPIMIDDITKAVYTNVSKGLFERHKLVFSFLLSVNIDLQMGKITPVKWDFLLRGPVGAKPTDKLGQKPNIPTLTDDLWQTILYVSETFPKFKRLPESCSGTIQINLGEYEEIIQFDPDNNNMIVDWNSALLPFDKLMIIKALKEEKLIFAITNYVSSELGKLFIESPAISYQLLYNDTSSSIPLVFILSPGSDPFNSFQKFALEYGIGENFQSISLGQGQGPIAEKLIMDGKDQGNWVFLQNCHLALSWMLRLETLVQELIENPTSVRSDFRLFLSSMPSKTFPTYVLQNSLKVTNEAPKGLKANMKRSFFEMNVDFFEDNAFGSEWRKMVFGLCFFHSIILERRKFGSLGWNILYAFTDSDRECAMHQLEMYCLASNTIPWSALSYITGEITYGGRVTDFWDQRTLRNVLWNFFAPHTMELNYKYSKSGTYYCPESPNCKTLEDYQQFINQLPVIEGPEVFGMHENANIAFQTKETQGILQTIIEGYPKSSGGSAENSDDIVANMANDISERLMKFIDVEQANFLIVQLDNKGRLPSLSTVLIQEVERFNKLLDIIHISLNDLRKAIKGLVVMSSELEGVYVSFLSNTIPKIWSQKAYPSLKSLGSWVKDLVMRLDFIDIWLKFGSPLSYWISGLYFPQGFMTGCLQRHSRKYSIPIDSLKVDFELSNIVLNQEEITAIHTLTSKEDYEAYKGLKALKDGVYVHGLFLDAGRVDLNARLLVDPNPGELYPPLPVMRLVPTVELDEISLRYHCPLYKTAIRAGVLSTTGHSTNFVVVVLLPTEYPESYWIQKGTALITQITN